MKENKVSANLTQPTKLVRLSRTHANPNFNWFSILKFSIIFEKSSIKRSFNQVK